MVSRESRSEDSIQSSGSTGRLSQYDLPLQSTSFACFLIRSLRILSHLPRLHAQADDKLYFPARFNSVPEIVKAMNCMSCIDNGYEVTSASKKGDLHYICCESCRIAKPTKKKKYDETHSSKPHDNSQTCKFKLVLRYDDDTKKYFIRRNGGHCLFHNSHNPAVKEVKEHGTRNVPKADLKDAVDMLKRNVDGSVVKELVQLRTGMKLSNEALYKLKQTMVIDKHKKDANESMATTFINMVEDNPDVEYVAFYGSYSEATKKVRVRKSSSTRKRSKKKKNTSSKKKSSNNDVLQSVVEQKVSALDELKETNPTTESKPSTSTTNDTTNTNTTAKEFDHSVSPWNVSISLQLCIF